ncbi:MBL fold metallo-hydrolase, partial [Tsukamurella pulmonis]
MRLTILGCSGSVGGPLAACSGYLLEVDGHPPVVMDFGPGVLGELQQRVDPNTATVMLSHLHADHCLDLPSLLVWRRYHPEPAAGRAP